MSLKLRNLYGITYPTLKDYVGAKPDTVEGEGYRQERVIYAPSNIGRRVVATAVLEQPTNSTWKLFTTIADRMGQTVNSGENRLPDWRLWFVFNAEDAQKNGEPTVVTAEIRSRFSDFQASWLRNIWVEGSGVLLDMRDTTAEDRKIIVEQPVPDVPHLNIATATAVLNITMNHPLRDHSSLSIDF